MNDWIVVLILFVSLGLALWVGSAVIRRLVRGEPVILNFDPEMHLLRHDLEDHIDDLSYNSESKSQRWSEGTTGYAYNCGYQAALKDIDKYLKGHASDSLTDKNKHDV